MNLYRKFNKTSHQKSELKSGHKVTSAVRKVIADFDAAHDGLGSYMACNLISTHTQVFDGLSSDADAMAAFIYSVKPLYEKMRGDTGSEQPHVSQVKPSPKDNQQPTYDDAEPALTPSKPVLTPVAPTDEIQPTEGESGCCKGGLTCHEDDAHDPTLTSDMCCVAHPFSLGLQLSKVALGHLGVHSALFTDAMTPIKEALKTALLTLKALNSYDYTSYYVRHKKVGRLDVSDDCGRRRVTIYIMTVTSAGQTKNYTLMRHYGRWLIFDSDQSVMAAISQLKPTMFSGHRTKVNFGHMAGEDLIPIFISAARTNCHSWHDTLLARKIF